MRTNGPNWMIPARSVVSLASQLQKLKTHSVLTLFLTHVSH